MRIYVTGYFGSGPTPSIIKELREFWSRCAERVGAHLIFVEPAPYQIHGELLTRLWANIRYSRTLDPHDDQICIISEIDFLPDPVGLRLLRSLPPGHAAFTPNVTRDSSQVLHDHWPLTGPWFMALNLTGITTWPPLNWLGADGPFNDAANMARQIALDSGFLREENCTRLDFCDFRRESPRFMGLELPGFGVHAFWSSRFDEQPEYLLDPIAGYTISEHIAGLRRLLAERTASFLEGSSEPLEGPAPGAAPC